MLNIIAIIIMILSVIFTIVMTVEGIKGLHYMSRISKVYKELELTDEQEKELNKKFNAVHGLFFVKYYKDMLDYLLGIQLQNDNQ